MRIDLHAHSTESDGTLKPAEVMRAAEAAGLDVVALTDHDTLSGWDEAAGALPAGLTLVPGVEFSCRWYAVDPPAPVHLLGYLVDSADPELTAELATVRAARVDRAALIVERLRADGIDLTLDEVRGYAGGESVGRPHIARALVARGLVGSVSEAFAPQWLGERYRIAKVDTEVFRAVQLVVAAGGVAVVAHPRAPRQLVPDELLAELAAAGLFGVEADHPEHDPETRRAVRGLAAELGLAVTGASDFHGGNKTVRLGDYTTDPEVYERIVATATGTRPRRRVEP